MSGNRSLLLLFFIGIPLFAVEEEISQHYKSGMDAYKKGQYDLAIQEFESILSNNWDSPELYYNLGNAYYIVNNIPLSIWSYEKSLKLNPLNDDVIFNLDY